MTNVPIRPELITWAREYRGLSQTQAAERLSVSVDYLAALESGDKSPNFGLFEILSKRLEIPSGFLLCETPPKMLPLPTDFRTVGGYKPKIGFETRSAISYAQTIAENIRELATDKVIDTSAKIPTISIEDDPDVVGERERSRLEVTAKQQLKWKSGHAFGNWKSIIEGAGTFVLSKKFPLDDCRGFTVFDYAEAPLIVISNQETEKNAKTFTLVHEYAHLLLNEPGLSDHNNQNKVEVFCNKFAAAFLMPNNPIRELIRELIGPMPNEPREWKSNEIKSLSSRLKVSQQAVALRLESLGIAPEGFFHRFRSQQHKATPRKSSGGPTPAIKQLSRLGERFVGSVLSAHRKEEITSFEAAEVLNLSPKHFDEARNEIEKRDDKMAPLK